MDLFAGDYRSMTGEGIPFRKLGFDSLGAFLQSLPELVVRKLPTGGMMVALTASTQPKVQNLRNVTRSRNMPNPQKPIRRPKQQSINWTPPARKHNRSKENLHPVAHKPYNNQDAKRQNSFNNNNNESKRPQQKQSKPSKNAQNESVKSPNKTGTKKLDKPAVSSKVLLEEYCKKKQFEPLAFKIATMGNKGKLR